MFRAPKSVAVKAAVRGAPPDATLGSIRTGHDDILDLQVVALA